MHILFLPKLYPHRYDTMWGLFVLKHAQAIKKFHDISVIYLYAVDEGLEKTEIIEEDTDSIYSVHIYYPKPKNKIIYFIHFLKYYFKAFEMVNRKRKVDLIHVHVLTRVGLLALISSRLKGIPYLITEHWSRYLPSVDTYQGRTRKFLTKLVVKNAKAVLPVTENLKQAMQSHQLNNKHYRVIANVVDDIFFESSIKKPKGDIKRVIHVSTFINKSKNITGIVDAIEKLSKIRNDFKMVLIGEGENFEDINIIVKARDLEKHIEFTGVLEKQELVDEYMRASFLLINSNYENMPVVINEAMACGLPVLSTNVGGISEHLDTKKGRLIAPQEPQQLLEQFQWMLDHLDSFEPSSIRQYAKEHFSFDAVGLQLDEVYQSIIKEK